MPYSIPSSTKIFDMTTEPFLFILVGALSVCEFAMVTGLHILLPESTDIYTHSAAKSSKRFKPLSVTILLWQGHC